MKMDQEWASLMIKATSVDFKYSIPQLPDCFTLVRHISRTLNHPSEKKCDWQSVLGFLFPSMKVDIIRQYNEWLLKEWDIRLYRDASLLVRECSCIILDNLTAVVFAEPFERENELIQLCNEFGTTLFMWFSTFAKNENGEYVYERIVEVPNMMKGRSA